MHAKMIDDEYSGALNKCPNCGSTEVSYNASKNTFQCLHCRTEFVPIHVFDEKPIEQLDEIVISTHAQDVEQLDSSMITIKCTGCGAEVVIDINETHEARCHWCRQTLSVDNQIPNGLLPDTVLPFTVTKEQAQQAIKDFIKPRRFFASPYFKASLKYENILGVYFPYAVIDFNVHANLEGEGEIFIRKYSVKSGDHYKEKYDADVYDVSRIFDVHIDNLTVETQQERIKINDRLRTNNIINSIMPFDIENSVKWSSKYLKDYSSEKRNLNVDQIKNLVEGQVKDISRHKINEDLTNYNRGIKWTSENYQIKGERWSTAYLPVWVYSYKDMNDVIHYIAVNGRTKETMGSVPINYPLLILLSIIIELDLLFLAILINNECAFLLLLFGPAFYLACIKIYRNKEARHHFETETQTTLANIERKDIFKAHRKRLAMKSIQGMNNKNVNGVSK